MARATCIPGSVVSRFIQSSGFTLEQCDGPLLAMLEREPMELLGSGWRQVLHPEDLETSNQIHADIHRGHGGIYQVRNISRSGDLFMLKICTMTLPNLGLAYGTAILEDIQINRKHVDLADTKIGKG